MSLSIDDFDPLIVYNNYTQWNTPNPQDHPTWFNSSSDVTGSPWHQATYHYTNISNARASFNFTGSSVTIYGAASPTGGLANFTVSLDSGYLAYPFTANYSLTTTAGRNVLYSSNPLFYGKHEVVLQNVGQGLLLDLVVVGYEAGANGSTSTNTTLDNPSPSIVYTGNWSTNQDPNFYGGSSIYTSTPGDSMSLNFTGSTVYLYGDQVNDHGPYSVYLNDSLVTSSLSGRSGCAGLQGTKTCEKLGGLHFQANNLPMGTHNLRVVNGGAAGSISYFDFDYLTYTTPSVYSNRVLITNSTCPFIDCSNVATGSPTSPTSGTATSKASGADMIKTINMGPLAVVLLFWSMLKVLRMV